MNMRTILQLFKSFGRKDSTDKNPFSLLEEPLETCSEDSQNGAEIFLDCDGYSAWIRSERRNHKRRLLTEEAQCSAAIDRLVEVIDNGYDGNIYILRVSRANFNMVANIISQYLSLKPRKIKRKLRKEFPAVFDCGSKEKADILRSELDQLCVCT